MVTDPQKHPQTHTSTPRQDRLQYNVPQLASAQCKNEITRMKVFVNKPLKCRTTENLTCLGRRRVPRQWKKTGLVTHVGLLQETWNSLAGLHHLDAFNHIRHTSDIQFSTGPSQPNLYHMSVPHHQLCRQHRLVTWLLHSITVSLGVSLLPYNGVLLFHQ